MPKQTHFLWGSPLMRFCLQLRLRSKASTSERNAIFWRTSWEERNLEGPTQGTPGLGKRHCLTGLWFSSSSCLRIVAIWRQKWSKTELGIMNSWNTSHSGARKKMLNPVSILRLSEARETAQRLWAPAAPAESSGSVPAFLKQLTTPVPRDLTSSSGLYRH